MPRRSAKLSIAGKLSVEKAFAMLGLTQQEVASIANVSRSSVSKFLNAKPVAIDIFIRICTALGIDWTEVVKSNSHNQIPARQSFNTPVAQLPSSEEDSQTDIATERLVSQFRNRVRPDIETRCGTMRILDMSQPMELDRIYTQVNILEKIVARRRKEIDELTQVEQPESFERFNLGRVVEEKIRGEAAVLKYDKLFILGKPGAGKTTFLKHLAIHCNKGRLRGDLVPFFVTLKNFAEAKQDLAAYLHSWGAPLVEPEDPESLRSLIKILSAGKALILLDGLDEVLSEDSKQVITAIEHFTNIYPKNLYVMTCRIAAKEYTFEKFTEVELADFDQQQIAAFARNWFSTKLIAYQQFLDGLDFHQPIQELASSPLLLTLLCLAFEESGSFPANRKELYREGLNALLRRWDSTRGIQRDKVYKPLSVTKKEDLLSNIAWETFAAGNYFFKQDQVEILIRKYLEDLPGVNLDDGELEGNIEIVLKNIEAQHGLLVARAKHIYSFSHLTFQEYFAAREVIQVRQAAEEALGELASHIFERRWREVLLLAVAMSSNANRLCLLIKQHIEQLVQDEPLIQELLQWLHTKAPEPSIRLKAHELKQLQSITQLNISIQSLQIKALYLAFSLPLILSSSSLETSDFLSFTEINALAESIPSKVLLDLYLMRLLSTARTCTYSIDSAPTLKLSLKPYLAKIALLNLDPKFQEDLEKLKRILPPENNQIKYWSWWQDYGTDWTEELRDLMIKYRQVGHNWQFNLQQQQLLTQYLESNRLLAESISQDCYVSPEVHSEIEETMLLPCAEIAKRNPQSNDN